MKSYPEQRSDRIELQPAIRGGLCSSWRRLLAGLPPCAARQSAGSSALERQRGERVQGGSPEARRRVSRLSRRTAHRHLRLGRRFHRSTSMAPVSRFRAAAPLFRVLVGEVLRLSGSLRSISQTGVRLGVSWQGPEIVLPRPGVQVVLQRPGVARVLVDNFESLEPSRWTKNGKVSLVDEPHASERKSLRIPSGGASLAHKLDEPLSAGRFELAYHDDGSVAPGQRWSIDLTFLGPTGPSLLRVIPGWADESLAVESLSGPALHGAAAGSHAGMAPIGTSLRARERPRSRSTGRTWRTAKGRRVRSSPSGLASLPARCRRAGARSFQGRRLPYRRPATDSVCRTARRASSWTSSRMTLGSSSATSSSARYSRPTANGCR